MGFILSAFYGRREPSLSGADNLDTRDHLLSHAYPTAVFVVQSIHFLELLYQGSRGELFTRAYESFFGAIDD